MNRYRYPSEPEARALWESLGLVPLVPYPGSGQAWRSVHTACGYEVAPSYGGMRTRLAGAGYRGTGCRYCSSKGPSSEVMDYLLATYETPAAHDPGWLYSTVHGYGQVALSGGSWNQGSGVVRVHNYVCELVWGPAPVRGMVAAHSCPYNRACFYAEHLSWKTRKQNYEDRIRDEKLLGLSQGTGESLGAIDRRRIRKLRAMGTSLVALGEAYEIGIESVRVILRGEDEGEMGPILPTEPLG